MFEYIAGLLEWLPIWPEASGHIAGISGLILIGDGVEPWPVISALTTSSFLAAIIKWLNYTDTVIGGLIVAGLSFIGILAVIFIRWGLLAVNDGRSPDVMDGFVSGFVQGISPLGFGGSGLSLALLTSSGVSIRKALLLSSVASLPPAIIQVLFNPLEIIWLLYILEGIFIVILVSKVNMRPSSFGGILSSILMVNVIQVKFIEEKIKQYQVITEEISKFVKEYGAIGLFLAMVLQAVVSPIPADAVLVAAGALGMTPLEVGIYGGMGIAVGSLINYFIARAVGKKILEYYIRGDLLEKIYSWFNRWGGWLVFLTRLIPFLPLDIISYIAGAVGMDLLIFILANVLATVPRATFFGFMGTRLAEGDWVFIVISIVLLLIGAYVFSKQVIRGKKVQEVGD